MSKGAGKIQRECFSILVNEGPLTFDEICGTGELTPATRWSIRRALQKMIRGGAIITKGRGGRGDPRRYSVDPMMLVLMEYERLHAERAVK
jgi:predicted transcriptional regulator